MLTLQELPQVCAPDTILLLDISASMKGDAFKEMKAAVHDFLDSKLNICLLVCFSVLNKKNMRKELFSYRY